MSIGFENSTLITSPLKFVDFLYYSTGLSIFGERKMAFINRESFSKKP